MAWVGPRARAHSRATLHPRRPAPGPCAWKAKKRKKPCGREWGGRASALSRAAACMNLHVHVRVHVHVRPLITGQLYMYPSLRIVEQPHGMKTASAASLLLGLVALPTAAPLRVAPGVKTIQRVRGKVGVTLCESSNYPGGLGNERAQLAKVSSLWPDTTGSVSASLSAQEKLWLTTGRDPRMKVSGLQSEEPSFTRIFTHATWSRYTGRQPLIRWLTISSTWRFSTILYAVAPIAALSSLWAFIIARLPAVLLPRTSPVPMSLMGTALGLLLVFRTNNSYLRLMEVRARGVWECDSCRLLRIRPTPHTPSAEFAAPATGRRGHRCRHERTGPTSSASRVTLGSSSPPRC